MGLIIRRKLFSEPAPKLRRRLFSEPECEANDCRKTNSRLICQDCGYELDTNAYTTNGFCPKCGGRRFNHVEGISDMETIERRPLFGSFGPGCDIDTNCCSEEEFQKEFSYTDDELEMKLKEFSGETLDSKTFQKQFGNVCTADELEEKGFAEVSEDGSVKISDTAFLQSRLFSKLVISVTKVLDLDPIQNPIHAINDLEGHGCLCPKSIVILKKAHGITDDSWAKDSGILGDLKLEFGGQCKPLGEFKNTINERYPDAPSGIMDILSKFGIIKTLGDRVEILK